MKPAHFTSGEAPAQETDEEMAARHKAELAPIWEELGRQFADIASLNHQIAAQAERAGRLA